LTFSIAAGHFHGQSLTNGLAFIRVDASVFCDQCRVERLVGQPEVDAWQTDESFAQVAHA